MHSQLQLTTDIVTDMYLKSIKEFKPTPAKASDAEGQVKNWSAPKAPPAPETATADLSSELSAYESADAGSTASQSSSASETDGDWFELDTAPDRAHH